MERHHIEALLDPAAYGERTTSVSIVQTHVSFLFLTDTHVYKIKKPVDFGFLNFTTLDRRRFFCEEEVRLNRRLCPDVYLGVVELRESPSGVSFHGSGKVIDYAVRMKRLPGERMLDRLLAEGKVGEEDVRRIARVIGEFHLHAERGREIEGYGGIETIRCNWEENFRQIAPFVSRVLSENDLRLLRRWVERFLGERPDLFARRVAEGHIRDCDGDIHSENICLDDRVYIFDCIEFNARFRFTDTASDIAFLLMDLEFRGRRDLAEILLDEYLTVTDDLELPEVLDFYRVYRACVRGKVESFRLDDPQVPESDKGAVRESARRHFRLARGYILRPELSPSLIAFSGLMGTGKSTLARGLSFQLGLDLVSSDILRKELAGVPATEHRRDAFNEGLYSPEFTRLTYGEMLRRARESLRAGRGVVVDASFSRREDRACFAGLAREMGVPLHFFHAACPETVIMGRLEARTDEPLQVSDGRMELLARQRDDFEPISAGEEGCVEVDTSPPSDETVDAILKILGCCDGMGKRSARFLKPGRSEVESINDGSGSDGRNGMEQKAGHMTEDRADSALARELETARRIQLLLLPEVPHGMLGVRIACRSIPAHQVGGDYYDFFRWDESTLDLVIADVSGHDLGAALIMVETRSVLRAHAYRAGDAGDALSMLNELLYDDLTRTELFLSMFYAKYCTDTRLLSYASAGHNSPLLLRCGREGCMDLDADGMILGVMKGVTFEEKNIRLQEGDMLVLYTDGITETRNGSGDLFGRDRLCRAVYAHRGAPPEAVIDGVLAEVRVFSGDGALQDDISLVVMKID